MDSFELDERQRGEAVRRWLRENGSSVTIGLTFGTLLVSGWVVYTTHQKDQAEAASPIFSELMRRTREQPAAPEQVRELAGKLHEEYPSTTYSVLAALAEAKAAVAEDDLERAGERLQWVIDQSDSRALQHLARMRLVRLRLYGNGRAEEAERLLKEVPEDLRGARYYELIGDLRRAAGNLPEARTAYLNAIEHGPEEIDAWIQPKLDDLGNALETAAPGQVAGDGT